MLCNGKGKLIGKQIRIGKSNINIFNNNNKVKVKKGISGTTKP